MTQFVGHRVHEYEYYRDVVSQFSKELFGIEPKLRKELENVLRVNLYSKDLFLLLTERFKIKAGRKSSEVLIPNEILQSSSDIILSCVAGLYDAEGCVFFDKRTVYKKPYPRLDFHVHNPSLIEQLSFILRKENISHSISGDNSRILIYGNNKVRSFLVKVKLFNSKHLNKLKGFV